MLTLNGKKGLNLFTLIKELILGVIAQEIEAILPEVVTTRENGYKAVKYEKLVAVLIEAVKELDAKIEKTLKNLKYLKSKRGALAPLFYIYV